MNPELERLQDYLLLLHAQERQARQLGDIIEESLNRWLASPWYLQLFTEPDYVKHPRYLAWKAGCGQ